MLPSTHKRTSQTSTKSVVAVNSHPNQINHNSQWKVCTDDLFLPNTITLQLVNINKNLCSLLLSHGPVLSDVHPREDGYFYGFNILYILLHILHFPMQEAKFFHYLLCKWQSPFRPVQSRLCSPYSPVFYRKMLKTYQLVSIPKYWIRLVEMSREVCTILILWSLTQGNAFCALLLTGHFYLTLFPK